MLRQDPGDCPICGAAHGACGPTRGAIVVPQLPQRDAKADPEPGNTAPLGDGSDDRPFSTATYRGKKARR